MSAKELKYFVIYESNVVTLGAEKALVCDLHRGDFISIPKSFGEFMIENNRKRVADIYEAYGEDNAEVLDEYFEFIWQNEIGFLTKDASLFPAMSTKWNEPAHITNAIVDISNQSSYTLNFLTELRSFGTKHIQFRMLDEISVAALSEKLNEVVKHEFESIEIILKCTDEWLQQDLLNEFTGKFPTVSLLTIMNAPKTEHVQFHPSNFGHVYFSTLAFHGVKSCGSVSADYFNTNIKSYTESLNHNSCLNRKLSIDEHGNIKNCPSMKLDFGNVAKQSLSEIIQHKAFKKLWSVTKDKVSGCKDCEYRYICIDCRAYLEDPKDGFSKPLKCGYDPYTAEWSDWSTNPLKQKAIDFYGMSELVGR